MIVIGCCGKIGVGGWLWDGGRSRGRRGGWGVGSRSLGKRGIGEIAGGEVGGWVALAGEGWGWGDAVKVSSIIIATYPPPSIALESSIHSTVC